MNIDEAVARWKESGGISTASHGGGYDTCFEYCFTRVLTAWATKVPA